MDQFMEYLVAAPMAVILFAYIWFSDRQKNKLIQGAQDQNKDLINLIKDLTKK